MNDLGLQNKAVGQATSLIASMLWVLDLPYREARCVGGGCHLATVGNMCMKTCASLASDLPLLLTCPSCPPLPASRRVAQEDGRVPDPGPVPEQHPQLQPLPHGSGTGQSALQGVGPVRWGSCHAQVSQYCRGSALRARAPVMHGSVSPKGWGQSVSPVRWGSCHA